MNEMTMKRINSLNYGGQLSKYVQASCHRGNQCSPLFSTVIHKRNVSHSGHCTWNYETERKTFKLTAPEYYNFARDVVDKWAKKEKRGERGDNPAFWWTNESGQEIKWTFQDLSEKSKIYAKVLTGPCKLKPGDKVIVILPRIPHWWLLNLAAIRAGIILSPGTTLLRPKDIKYRLDAAEARCIITDKSSADNVDQVADTCPSLVTKVLVDTVKRAGWLSLADLSNACTSDFKCINSRASDPMTVFFTSGTTGSPKMTEHTHGSYGLGHLITARYFLNLGPSDVMWNLSDTGWAKSAWSSLFAPWINGACVFVQEAPRFDPTFTLKMLEQFPITHFCTAPTASRQLVKQRLGDCKFRKLKWTFCAGEPVNPELLDEWKEGTGLTMYEGYGQTETTFLCGTYPCIVQKPGSMGKPAPGYDLQIVDDDGNIIPNGKEGNIGIKCNPERPVGLFKRYINDEDRMKSVFRGDFYLTGDRAIKDDDGYIWFVGRADDVILSSGYRIGPFEVESALIEHPAVLESAAVSSPDKDRGEPTLASPCTNKMLLLVSQ
ncbi:hypothetical protein ACJMK2_034842 [Sinanodonta woodiana]|uniref:medium-chain acyl-CoA ligase n=1 Tax=Sinanodonta woodiana TaxID=1069815 RepID=A0ABD3WWG1_SINWO